MLHAIIMAGGSGTRFWPESRRAQPKHLLRLFGDRTLLRQAYERVAGLVPPERTWVITAAAQVADVARDLPELPETAIVAEPCGRDTAPCIGLAATLIAERDPEAVMLVTPADHLIHPDESFQHGIHTAVELVEQEPQSLVTYGVRPTYPATGYGYIERGEERSAVPTPPSPPFASGGADRAAIHRVRRFTEKPPLETAARYVATGRYYWNSGIFVWRAARILELLAQSEPQLAAGLARIGAARGEANRKAALQREYPGLKKVSIDYAVMERAPDVFVIEAPFEWDDVGSWRALERAATKTPAFSQEPGVSGDARPLAALHVAVDTTGCIVRGPADHLIATVGVENLVIVHTPDVTLVARKDDEEGLKRLVARLAELGYDQYL